MKTEPFSPPRTEEMEQKVLFSFILWCYRHTRKDKEGQSWHKSAILLPVETQEISTSDVNTDYLKWKEKGRTKRSEQLGIRQRLQALKQMGL